MVNFEDEYEIKLSDAVKAIQKVLEHAGITVEEFLEWCDSHNKYLQNG
jgi:hypothetical protein